MGGWVVGDQLYQLHGASEFDTRTGFTLIDLDLKNGSFYFQIVTCVYNIFTN